ncbi:epoxyqueuosine reductase [Komagataeibacter rhaeticus]|uniref:Epoxyqueuosine reductase n=1 Tax=Komagataeibacter rhaeticus TaxID=215221 RepID=A0A181C6Z0_9PROT|nr:tRNA epoxyqueuosine(34) reductase QueG [Komagataeibacter rhaeticus]KDU94851.1 epoxyqueuosine reductase [Komagataeibacter rhaeticus AF1]MBL7239323.1 tRNA epoxyqueuosine(34) reductase QueG [Komagataeibacter rhaeticus]PYD55108.1 epoxyqueuosine reductase [Komagataeibacter rhaeticus]QIP34301.1 tRNA epoxyqueuosine(34) reductase QueG [Komagataeibacter rhaeticus]QOC46810.1 tRNA epoxyqueuosine(34) reductase QueG [Komagataeibacter rhaeticus]
MARAACAHDPAALAARIADHARRLGFDAVGFTPARLDDGTRARLAAFVENGFAGSMGWMAQRMEQRGDPRGLWPEVRSVIALGVSYTPDGDPLATTRVPDAGNISVYARNRDYHDVVKGMLKHLAQFVVNEGRRQGSDTEVKVFVDTAPVMEKPLARDAGLGWQGKHTSLVSRQHGSWLFLGEVYTTLDLPQSAPSGGGCGTCTRCLVACPTDAFPAPGVMDARRCLSYLTIENRGPIPHALRPAMGNRIYGCDDCLAACPWNRFAQATRHMKLAARDDLRAPALRELAALDDGGFRRRFSGSPIKRIGRERFVRNVAVAIGNSGQPALRPAAMALCSDPDPVVAEAARWAVARLPR